MERNYNVTGAMRKELVKAVSEALNIEPVYKGVPTCAYAVSNFTISKDGRLIWDERVSDEEAERVMESLRQAGFEAEEELEQEEEDTSEELESEPEENTDEESEPEEDTNATDNTEPVKLNIEMPRSFFTDEALENLKKIIDSKAALLKKAVGAEELPVEIGEEKVSFPWFTASGADEAKAYGDLISRMSIMAKEAKRVTAKEKEVESERYAFRCFLVRAGMSGPEFKTDRKILLQNLDGPSAFPTRAAADEFSAKQKEKRDAAKAEALAGEEA